VFLFSLLGFHSCIIFDVSHNFNATMTFNNNAAAATGQQHRSVLAAVFANARSASNSQCVTPERRAPAASTPHATPASAYGPVTEGASPNARPQRRATTTTDAAARRRPHDPYAMWDLDVGVVADATDVSDVWLQCGYWKCEPVAVRVESPPPIAGDEECASDVEEEEGFTAESRDDGPQDDVLHARATSHSNVVASLPPTLCAPATSTAPHAAAFVARPALNAAALSAVDGTHATPARAAPSYQAALARHSAVPVPKKKYLRKSMSAEGARMSMAAPSWSRPAPAGHNSSVSSVNTNGSEPSARPIPAGRRVVVTNPDQRVVAHVQFRCRTTAFTITASVAAVCSVGSSVFVDGVRGGDDVGKLVGVSSGSPVGAILKRAVRRPATHEEDQRRGYLWRRADDALLFLRDLQRDPTMPAAYRNAEIVDCEFQLDGKTLITHIRTKRFIDTERIDALLYPAFHARAWVWVSQPKEHGSHE